jgi:HEAT repeat protein
MLERIARAPASERKTFHSEVLSSLAASAGEDPGKPGSEGRRARASLSMLLMNLEETETAEALLGAAKKLDEVPLRRLFRMALEEKENLIEVLLLRYFEEKDPLARRRVLPFLTSDTLETLTLLLRILKSERALPAPEVIHFLVNTGHPRASDLLMHFLDHREPEIRTTALRTLAEAAPGRALEPILEALEDGDEAVRKAAIMLLGGYSDGKAIDALKRCAEELDILARHTDEQLLALESLGKISHPRALEVLKELSQRSWWQFLGKGKVVKEKTRKILKKITERREREGENEPEEHHGRRNP